MGRRAFWLGLAGSAGFLALLAFLLVDDFQDIADALRSANYVYVVPSLALYFAAVYFRTVRWKFLLTPLMGPAHRAIYPVVIVGYMANNLIPVRIGEVVRSYYLSLREQVSASSAFGTVAVERASDVLALLFFLFVAGLFLPVTGAIGDVSEKVPGGAAVLAMAALLPFLGVAAVVAIITMLSPVTVLRFVERILSPLPEKLSFRLLGLAGRLLEGLTVVRSPRSLLILFLLSLPVWSLEAAMYYTISLGFDLRPFFGSQMEYIAAILLFTAAANLAGVLPTTAGGWGPFDFFGATALVALGVPLGVASAFAVTVHVALWLPVTALGLGMLLLDGMSFRRLLRSARADRAAPPVAKPAGTGT